MLIPDHIFEIKNAEEFESCALKVFRYQAVHNLVYNKYLQLTGISINQVQQIDNIPFMPISFFKNQKVISGLDEVKLLFQSSGTTQENRSKHYLTNPELYRKSFTKSYKNYIGNPENQIIVGLLPNYIERGDSSLVYMVNELIKQTKNAYSGFILGNNEEVFELNQLALEQEKQFVLFGVSYSLLDLCEFNKSLQNVWIIETGGMKGYRKEIPKEELYLNVNDVLKPTKLFSEYGMTELCSQAYAEEDGIFRTPNWMKVLISEVDDPFGHFYKEKRGRINVIDLANYYSCSFIQTDDLGINYDDGFQLLGRVQDSDVRGCNQLVV